MRSILLRAASLASLTACACLAQAATPREVSLAAGSVHEQRLEAGAIHSYSVALQAGDYLAVDLNERGIDIALDAIAPAGTVLASETTREGKQDTGRFRLIAREPGTFRLRLRALSKPAGSYRLQVVALRAATKRDENDTLAHDAWQRAQALDAQGTPDATRAAVQEYSLAAHYYELNGDAQLQARAVSRTGGRYYQLDDRPRAIEALQKAVTLYRSAGDMRGEAGALNNLGAIHQSLAEPAKAIDYFTRALPGLRATGDKYQEAAVVHNLGWYYHTLGEFKKAGEHYRTALPLWRAAGNVPGEAQTTNNLGLLNLDLGELDRSRTYFATALKLRRAAADRSGEAQTLVNLGSVSVAMGDRQKAEALFRQALGVARQSGNAAEQASSHFGLALAQPNAGSDQVTASSNAALALARQIGDRRMEASALHRLGEFFQARGEVEKAGQHYERALALQKASADARGEADSLLSLARLATIAGDLKAARSWAEQAVEIVESLRGQVAEPDLRSSYLATVQSHYDSYIDVLMRSHESEPLAGYDVQALQASERARARGLLDALREQRADIRVGVDPRLLEREQELRRTLNAKDQQWRLLLAGTSEEPAVVRARGELDEALARLREVQGEIRSSSPRYAQLTQPESVSLRALQQQLDSRSLLLEYWLGSERSFLWVITRDSAKSYVLPAAARIERQARQYFAALNTRPVSKAQEPAEQSDALGVARDLSVSLLGPVAGSLRGQRLIVVGHGALQYVPFAALPIPGSPAERPALLLSEHEIVSLPSASVLTALRTPSRTAREASKTIAVLADPVFSADDPRVTQRREPLLAAARTSEVMERTTEQDLSDLRRLRFSRTEADTIAALVPAAQRFQAVDFLASRETALSPELSQYRILHFATHGVIDSTRPELSGLVFSAVDTEGRPQDPLLRLHEIFNLSLRADLVVLSACQTALGRDIKGEGLIGLTRGFMYTGTPRVVATLWNVDDRASAELMKKFYEGLLIRTQTPAAALREAQLAMVREGRWAAPYYWAGFVLQGDWN
jgi:CHAT domain-containing protein/Tfp pilus assembly protein PilF